MTREDKIKKIKEIIDEYTKKVEPHYPQFNLHEIEFRNQFLYNRTYKIKDFNEEEMKKDLDYVETMNDRMLELFFYDNFGKILYSVNLHGF